ncbi:MAG: PPC domain-containing DNA-binding protein [Candidatus Woesearchaeota archaeon]
MQYRKYGSKIFVRIDKGEEIVEKLKELCAKEEITLGNVTGIGATDNAKIGLFDTKEKQYYGKELGGDMEIAPLSGNITTMDGSVYLHLHINLADKENRAFAGHLNSAIVSATFEGVIEVIEGSLERSKDEEIGLNLLDYEK